jgi:hypothetical protein
MRIRVYSNDGDATARVRRRLLFTLASMDDEIKQAHIVFDAPHARTGSRLARCRVELTLARGVTVAVEELQTNPELAVSRALDRCSRIVLRRLHAAP